MNIKVGKHLIQIQKEDLTNEKEINVTKCYFTFDEDITNNFVKEAYFTLNNGTTYKKIIVNNECDIPNEVLQDTGNVELGVVTYHIDNDIETRYNPSPCYFQIVSGSLKEAENSQEITPSELEQYEQALNDGLLEAQNVDIDASKSGSTAIITITNRNGEIKSVNVVDGANGQDGQNGNDGVGISSIVKTSTSGLVDTYTINYTNGNSTTYQVTNGKNGTDGTNGTNGVGISSISKTSTSGLVDTYTITYTNNNTSTYNVTNGKDGVDGQNGSDYVLTSADKSEIATIVLNELQTVDEVGF